MKKELGAKVIDKLLENKKRGRGEGLCLYICFVIVSSLFTRLFPFKPAVPSSVTPLSPPRFFLMPPHSSWIVIISANLSLSLSSSLFPLFTLKLPLMHLFPFSLPPTFVHSSPLFCLAWTSKTPSVLPLFFSSFPAFIFFVSFAQPLRHATQFICSIIDVPPFSLPISFISPLRFPAVPLPKMFFLLFSHPLS